MDDDEKPKEIKLESKRAKCTTCGKKFHTDDVIYVSARGQYHGPMDSPCVVDSEAYKKAQSVHVYRVK